MSKQTKIESLRESLGIHQTLLKEARLIQEGFPTLIAELDRDAAKLKTRRDHLVERHERAATDEVKWNQAIAEDRRQIDRLENPAKVGDGKVRLRATETKNERLARLRREVAKLEMEVER